MKTSIGWSIAAFILVFTAFAFTAQAETLTTTVPLSPANEVPPVTGLNASGSFLVSITVNRDANGNITGGSFTFLGTVSFPGSVTITGLHIHEQVIGQNGPIRFDSGINAANPVTLASGSGLINLTAQVTTAAGIEALGRLLLKPSGFYLNLHTSVNTGGALREQLLRLTETLGVSVAVSSANEVPPITGLNATGTGTITINPKRDSKGVVIGGDVTFTMNYKDFPANTVITGLHIHEAVAGQNGSVRIDTGISTNNSIPVPTGSGTLSRTVTLTTTTPIDALKRLLADPSGFYVNLHTTVNPSGALRGQLTALTAPLVIQQSSAYFLETGATDAQIALLIASADLASALTSTVLVNGQQVTAQLDLATGTFGVVIPAALRASAGTLFVQARSSTGLMSAPIVIIVASASSVNPVAFTTINAASYISSQGVAPESFATGRGTNLASQTIIATTLPEPTSLDGTSVYVNGIAAQLNFVSPTQVQYVIPAGTIPGPASVTVISASGTVSRGVALIQQTTPGLFTADAYLKPLTTNASGRGAAFGVASATGQIFDQLTYRFDEAQNKHVTAPIQAGFFLALFGTGLRYASGSATVKIGGVDVVPHGANFINSSVVRWNGNDRTTTFVSSTQLIATIPASDISTAGVASVTVFNPAPGGGVSNALAFTINQSCNYSIAPTSQPFGASSGMGNVTVTAGSGCSWTATSNAPSWLTITAGASGSGSGTVSYSVAANNGAARNGTLTIAGQTFTVTQGCAGTIINAQPGSRTVCVGAPASFSATASGVGALSYQWRKNGVNIAGATGSVYSIATVVAGDAGSYDVVTVSPPGTGATISGDVRYCITLDPVASAILTATNATGAVATTATSDVNGRYALTGLSSGFYLVTPTKGDSLSGLSAFDAARIAQHVENINRIESVCQVLSADANRDGALTIADALLILHRVVGLPDGGQTGKWRFSPDNRPYPSLNGDQSNQNYDAVLIGDVTGNWSRTPVLAITSVEMMSDSGNRGLMIRGEGFQPGLSLIVIFPDGGEMKLGAPMILEVKADSFAARIKLDPRAMLALRVINPDGRQSDAFALPRR